MTLGAGSGAVHSFAAQLLPTAGNKATLCSLFKSLKSKEKFPTCIFLTSFMLERASSLSKVTCCDSPEFLPPVEAVLSALLKLLSTDL